MPLCFRTDWSEHGLLSLHRSKAWKDGLPEQWNYALFEKLPNFLHTRVEVAKHQECTFFVGACESPLQRDPDQRPQPWKCSAWPAWSCEAHISMRVGKCRHWPQPESPGGKLLRTRGDQCRRFDPCRWLVELWSTPPPLLLRRPPSICASHWGGRFDPAALSWKRPPWCSRLHWRLVATYSRSETRCWLVWLKRCSPPPLLQWMGLGQNVLAIKYVDEGMLCTEELVWNVGIVQITLSVEPNKVATTAGYLIQKCDKVIIPLGTLSIILFLDWNPNLSIVLLYDAIVLWYIIVIQGAVLNLLLIHIYL